jgi:GGDEF domain-containing protein
MQTHLRSYEPVIRLSGDEFICTIADATIESVRERFGEITTALNATPDDGSITIGFAQLTHGDSPMDRIDRADNDLIAARNTSSRDRQPRK